MQATNRLRFVERDCYIKNGESFIEPFKLRVLQQWWEDGGWTHVQTIDGDGKFLKTGKWIDVPLEEEK